MEAVRSAVQVCTSWPYNVLAGLFLGVFGVYGARRFIAGGVCRSKAKLDGKTVIITGANTGIGKETAIDLAKRNARVIVACRSEQKGKEAETDVRRASGSSNVLFMKLDLASFDSIRKFAKDFLSQESRLDILINNAGVMMCPFSRTADGFELQFGVNHLGHFLLTNLLLDWLKRSPDGRIVNVSSAAIYFSGKLNLDSINSEEKYNKYRSYNNSKLANVLFSKALTTRLAGTNVIANALHPGAVRTDLQRHSWALFVARIFTGWLWKTPREGAQTSIHCAVAEEVKGVSGEYFSDCRVAAPPKLALDKEAADELWDRSMQWCKLETPSTDD